MKFRLTKLLLGGFACLVANLGFSQIAPGVAKVCTPCEDYFGMGGSTFANAGVIASSTPGLFTFYHLDHPDTNLVYLGASWFLNSDPQFGYNTSPVDSFVHQFTVNGPDIVTIQANYRIPEGMTCWGYQYIPVTVTGLPNTTPAPEPEATSGPKAVIAFPNPSHGTVHVQWQDPNSAKAIANLYDLTGRLVAANLRFVDGKLDMDLSALPAGNYPLVITAPNAAHRLTLMHY